MKQQSLFAAWGKKKRPLSDKEGNVSSAPAAKAAKAAPAVASAAAAVVDGPTAPVAIADGAVEAAPVAADDAERAAGDAGRAAGDASDGGGAASDGARPEYAGLSQYEIERLERIARNAEFMASLGLGDARDALAANAPSGLGPRKRAPPRRRKAKAPAPPAGPKRRSPRLAGAEAGGARGSPSAATASAGAAAAAAAAAASRESASRVEVSACAAYLLPAAATDVGAASVGALEDLALKRIYCVASNGGRLVAAAGKGGRVALFARSSPDPLASFKAHGGWVGGCAFLGASGLLTAGNDGRAILWDVATTRGLAALRETARVAAHGSGCWSLCVRGTVACTAGKDGSVAVLRAREDALDETARVDACESGAAKQVALNGVASAFLCATDDGAVACWDLRSNARAWAVDDAHGGGATSAAYRPNDENEVLTAGADAALRLWDARSLGAPVRTFEGHHRPGARRGAIHHPVWVAPDAVAVGGEKSNRLAFYNADTGALASLRLDADATAVAVVDAAADGAPPRVAVAVEGAGALYLHDAPAQAAK